MGAKVSPTCIKFATHIRRSYGILNKLIEFVAMNRSTHQRCSMKRDVLNWQLKCLKFLEI